jgi:hypothetical protein
MSDNSIGLITDFPMDDILFKGISLSDWEKDFTITIPNSNMTNLEMQRHISELNNKYHKAYNCYNELLVSYNKSEQIFNIKRGEAIKSLIDSMRADGVGKMPAKEVLAEMALSANNDVKNKHQELMLLDIIKTFFENNKSKLEKTMQLLINLSYLINASDKIHNRSGDPVL